ncbi:hypothetical protein NQZ68_039205 [Dissostichus eleginoides]|nr:hypothetical protein NQZ68_039205 [Dissostichus eleginoides]
MEYQGFGLAAAASLWPPPCTTIDSPPAPSVFGLLAMSRYLNNAGYDEGGAVRKQQNDNHTKTTRGHMPTHRISVIIPRFAPLGLLLSR